MNLLDNKEELNISYVAINELNLYGKNNIIPFPKVYKKICPLLKKSKNEARLILCELERKGFIKIIPFHGVKVLM